MDAHLQTTINTYVRRYGTLIVSIIVLTFIFCLRVFANHVIMPAVYRWKVSVGLVDVCGYICACMHIHV